MIKMSIFATAALVLGAAAALPGTAEAEEIEVKMLNRGAAGIMVFEPNLVEIEPGDSVRFVPVDKGHYPKSIEGMLPQGAAPFEGKRDEEITVTFDREGLYGFECPPHAGMGMVGAVVVGKLDDQPHALEGVKVRGKGKKVMAELLAGLGG